MKRIRISSSIANFKTKLRGRYWDYGDWSPVHLWEPTIFFGMYHWLDYLRLILHRGPRVVFWCGSDILQAPKWLAKVKALHYCENEVEWQALKKLGITSLVHPMFFGKPRNYDTTYVQADKPTVWMSYHPHRLDEYGFWFMRELARTVPEVDFVMFDGSHTEQAFDEVTAGYQATIRFNEFDGFSENIAKALLRGQYVFSAIPYEGCDNLQYLPNKLRKLAKVKIPNPASAYWREVLNKRIET